MRELRVPVEGLREGPFELDPAASRYVSRVNRLAAGDRFVAFDPDARLEAEARVVRVGRRAVVCELAAPRAAALIAKRPLWLLQGLCKGERFDQVVRDATALGVTDIVPVGLARCDVKLTDGSAARPKRWARIAVEAARQCGRGDVARLYPHVDLTRAMAQVPGDALRICLWELATEPLASLASEMARATSIALLIGPEGGLESVEVQRARQAGFRSASLGPFILRTETAATATLGAVMAMWGWAG